VHRLCDGGPGLYQLLRHRCDQSSPIGLSLTLATERATSAQEATPTSLPSALTEWIGGWRTRDPDRVAAIYAADATHEVVATGETLSGRGAIHANIAALMSAVPDAALSVNRAFATSERRRGH